MATMTNRQREQLKWNLYNSRMARRPVRVPGVIAADNFYMQLEPREFWTGTLHDAGTGHKYTLHPKALVKVIRSSLKAGNCARAKAALDSLQATLRKNKPFPVDQWKRAVKQYSVKVKSCARRDRS